MSGAPRSVGPYRLGRELGRGGMGVVFLAEAPGGDQVALKVLLSEDAEALARFDRELKALIRVAHPNVVRVLDLGEDGGRPFIVMDYVEGESVQVRLRRGPLAPRAAATIAHALAGALEAAHAQGVLHRDVKPANVLLRGSGEGEPQPLLSDFGLARQVGGAELERLTRTGVMIGTPAYTPPEQASGEHERIGPRTDVYGLGATLYAMLTGKPPHEGATAINVLNSVLRNEPPAPSKVQPGVDPDLERICLRCLAKEPEDRYPTARALQLDLAAYLEGASTPLGVAGNLKGALIALVIVVASVVGVFALSGKLVAPAPAPAGLGPVSSLPPESESDSDSEAGGNPATPPVGEGLAPSLPPESETPPVGEGLAPSLPPESESPPVGEGLAPSLPPESDSDSDSLWARHSVELRKEDVADVENAWFWDGGRRILTRGTKKPHKNIRIWTAAGELVKDFELSASSGRMRKVAVAPEGDRALVTPPRKMGCVDRDGATIWEVAFEARTPASVLLWRRQLALFGGIKVKRGKGRRAVFDGGVLVRFDLRDGARTLDWLGQQPARVTALAATSDEALLLVADSSPPVGAKRGTIRAIGLEDEALLSQADVPAPPTCVRVAPGDVYLLVGTADGRVLRYELPDLEPGGASEVFGDGVSSLSFMPDGRWVYVVSYAKGELVVLDPEGKELDRARLGFRPRTVDVALDGQRLVLAGDGRMEVWSIPKR